MLKSSFLKQLAEQLTAALPTELHTLRQDFEKKCRMTLNKTFVKLDVVTREEFDAQMKVLLRTRKKLEALQERVNDLEALLKPPAADE